MKTPICFLLFCLLFISACDNAPSKQKIIEYKDLTYNQKVELIKKKADVFAQYLKDEDSFSAFQMAVLPEGDEYVRDMNRNISLSIAFIKKYDLKYSGEWRFQRDTFYEDKNGKLDTPWICSFLYLPFDTIGPAANAPYAIRMMWVDMDTEFCEVRITSKSGKAL